MSSEHDESAELMEDLSMKSDAEKSGSPPAKKFQGPGDHTKAKKKGRRGKKRKQRKASGAAESENQEDSETHPDTEANRDSPTWDSDEEFDCEISAYNDVIIRPVNVPKAPENSTQFIIDDHNLCHLYMSFETPNPYRDTDPPESGKEGMALEPAGTDAAYIDIDFEYDPPQDFDNSAYYDKEFENSYKSNRFDDLLRMPRSDLISGLRLLEARLKELSDDLVKENPSPILEQLQAELLELQEKHNVLKDSNTSLTALVAQNEQGSNISISAEDSQRHLTLVNNVNFDKTTVEHQSPVSEMEVGEKNSRLEEELLRLIRVKSPEVENIGLINASDRTSVKCLRDARFETEDIHHLQLPTSEFPKSQLISEHEDESSPRLGAIESSPRLGEMELSPRLSEVGSSPMLGEMGTSPRLGEGASPRLGEGTSPRLGEVGTSPRLGEGTSPRLGEVGTSLRVGEVKLSPRLGEVKSSLGLLEVKSSCELERSILRDLPCRDHHSCDEASHSVASEEHELSAAVLV